MKKKICRKKAPMMLCLWLQAEDGCQAPYWNFHQIISCWRVSINFVNSGVQNVQDIQASAINHHKAICPILIPILVYSWRHPGLNDCSAGHYVYLVYSWRHPGLNDCSAGHYVYLVYSWRHPGLNDCSAGHYVYLVYSWRHPGLNDCTAGHYVYLVYSWRHPGLNDCSAGHYVYLVYSWRHPV